MLKILIQNKIRFVFVVFLILLFALIRFYEHDLFYDPFIVYFESDFNKLLLPLYDPFWLFCSMAIRYGLNMVVSLALMYVIFKEREMIKFVSILYLSFFVLLIILFFGILSFYEPNNNFLLFYIRRFIIQPLFVLLFIPAFYFQKRSM